MLVDQRTVQLSAAAQGHYESLQTGPLVVQQNGYVTIYVGNESNADVYFDDVTIEHRQGLQVQENQFDPFGLDLAGVSGAAPGLRLKNFYQFNGKENQLDLGLNWNHQDWRFFDYQIGRWHVVDPEIENAQESWTPYSFGFDNAVRFNDMDGRYPGDGGPGVLSVTGNFALGLGQSVWGTVTGVASVVAHPINTAQALGNVIAHPINTSKAIGNAVAEGYSDFQNGNADVKANIAGKVIGDVAQLFVGAGEVKAVTNALRGAKVAEEIGAVANTAKELEALSGSSRALGDGAPHSIYTQVSSDGKVAVQNTIYNSKGKATHQVDFKNHGQGATSGHGHVIKNPGEIGTGHAHTPDSFVRHEDVPAAHKRIPDGTSPSRPIGQ